MRDLKDYARQFSSGYNFITKKYRVTGKDVERLILWKLNKENKKKLSQKDKSSIRKEMKNKNSLIGRIMAELGLTFQGNTILDINFNVLYDMKNFEILDNLDNIQNKRKISTKKIIGTIGLIAEGFVLINVFSPLEEAENLVFNYQYETEALNTETQDIITAKQKTAAIISEAKNQKDETNSEETFENQDEENQESEEFEKKINEAQSEENFDEHEDNVQTELYYNGPHDKVSKETETVIEEQKYALTEDNKEEVLRDYDNNIIEYFRKLGGIFKKYAGKVKVVIKTAGDFQEFCEFIFAVLAILGPDYFNESSDEYIHWGKEVDDESSRFYTEDKYEGVSSKDDINTALNKGIININCSSGLQLILNSMMLQELENPIKITKKEDLQVLDIIYFKLKEDKKGVNHVAVVGEIDEENGEIIVYDIGRRFTNSENYKMKLSRDYKKYEYWYAKRKYIIDPSTKITINFNDENSKLDEETYR